MEDETKPELKKDEEEQVRNLGKQGEARLNVENIVLDEMIDIMKYRLSGLT